MSYQRVATPKIYVDIINPLLTNGTITGTDQITGTGILTTASSIIQLFDNKPNNTVTIGGNGGTTAQNIIVDTNIDTNDDLLAETMFVAVLGHNLKSADAQLKIQTDDDVNFGSAQSPTMTAVCNCETDSSSGMFARPATDGWSLFTYTQATDNRYQKLIIDDVNTFDTDIKIGCILWGVVYTFPNAPDLTVKKTFSYNGLKVNESLGGQKYAHATYLTNSSWTSTEAWDASSDKSLKTGRQQLDINFSFISDTDLFPSDLYDMTVSRTADTILNKLIFLTNGGMFPLLLQLDSTDANVDDGFLWCRLNNQPSFSQTAHRHYTTSLSFVEEF